MVEKNKIVAIIPARGGSKRIPNKNIIEFSGKPMIAWTIEAAIQSKIFERVIVSTDDAKIAEISLNYGAEVPFLRDSRADDHTPISLATIRTIEQLDTINNYKAEIVVQLMANCPLRDQTDIKLAIQNFTMNNLNFQISAFKYGWMNPWWAHQIDNNSIAKPIFSDEIRMKRSQDLPELFCPTGAIWIAKIANLLESGTFYGEDYSFFPMQWVHAIDIDNYEDMEMASLLKTK